MPVTLGKHSENLSLYYLQWDSLPELSIIDHQWFLKCQSDSLKLPTVVVKWMRTQMGHIDLLFIAQYFYKIWKPYIK